MLVAARSRSTTIATRHHRHTVANGNDVTDPERYPYFARLDFDGIQGCGGTLIHPEFVLTAAHCFDDTLDDSVTVFLGTLDAYDHDPTKQAVLLKSILHPNYDPLDFVLVQYDVALIQVEPVDFVEPVTLNTNDDGNRLVLSGGDPVRVFGFGLDETQTFPDILQEADMFITSDELCQLEYNEVGLGGIHGPSMICALDAQERQDSCGGDSGGPLIVSGGSANQDIQVGLVSSGIDAQCGQNEVAGKYTDVGFFYDWIQSSICEYATMPSATTCGNLTVDPTSSSSSATFGGMRMPVAGSDANSALLQVLSLLVLAGSSFLL